MTTTHDTRGFGSWIELSAPAYQANLAFLRQRIGPEVELAVVVKSNAYGHGLEPIARLAIDAGADSFCVHALDEALALRAAGFTQDILVMGHVPLARLGEAVAEDLRVVLYDPVTADALADAAERRGKRARAHLKVETGTNRQGIDGAELDGLVARLVERPSLDVEGVYTHFADIEDTTDHAFAREQLRLFRAAMDRLEAAGITPRKRHAACSAAAILYEETHFDMVRVGISQYGFWSSKQTRLSFDHRATDERGASDPAHRLQPVLTWKARISQIKTVPTDGFVGYGRTYQTTRDTRLAILPIGYADGYDRHLSNVASVLIGGRRAPVRGRICMNLTMVDVTDVPDVGLEDEVVLIGRQGDRRIDADDLADHVGTIPYEIVARLAAHLPRMIVDR
ncbi:MAG: alanine racemase [Acidobacteriota bacterium]